MKWHVDLPSPIAKVREEILKHENKGGSVAPILEQAQALNSYVDNKPKAKSPDAIRQPNAKQTEELVTSYAVTQEEGLKNLLGSILQGVDLQKYGIDPKTLNFLPGYGPNGKLPEPPPAPAKISFWQKVLNFFRR